MQCHLRYTVKRGSADLEAVNGRCLVTPPEVACEAPTQQFTSDGQRNHTCRVKEIADVRVQ